MQRRLFLTGVIFLLQAGIADESSSDVTARSSGIALTPNEELLLVVNSDSDSVSIVDVVADERLLQEIPVGINPQTIQSDQDGQFAFAVNQAEHSVSVLDLHAFTEIGCIPVADDPFGVVVGENYAFVSNQGADSISIIHLQSMRELMRLDVARAPRGLALSADGSQLYVTHFFSGEVSVIDTGLMQVVRTVSLGSSSNISQAIVLDESERKAYLPQTHSNSTNQSLLFDTTVFPSVSILDLDTLSNLRSQRIALDIADRPVGIPIDAIITDQAKLYVVNAASNDVSVVDIGTAQAIAHLEVGDNPRSIDWSRQKSRAYVNNTLAGTVSIIDTETDTVVDEIAVTELPLAPAILNGKKIFNSSDRTDLAREQWIACATCHFDGAHDARTWFFPDGPRNTPSLLGVGETLPLHWSGDLDELHDVESTIRTIQAGTGLTAGDANCSPACDQAPPNEGRSMDLDDLAIYMDSLRVFSRNRESGSLLTEVELAGKALFESSATGCAGCHVPSLYTDRLRHDVGTGSSPLELKGSAFETPSLRRIDLTAPYLHDGSAPTLEAVLTDANSSNRHGDTADLDEGELNALVTFLKALPFDLPHQSNRSCNLPVVSVDDSVAVAATELQLMNQEFMINDPFTLTLNVAGTGNVDVYVAVILPDGAFVTIDNVQTISGANQIIPFRNSLSLEDGVALPVVSTTVPAGLDPGMYTVYGIVVGSGVDVTQQENWIAVDLLSFQIH